MAGSGPAGLAAAQQLTRAGHDVTVYERDDGSVGCCVTASPSTSWRRRPSISDWPRCGPREPDSSPSARSVST
nr:NAD(P)-binding protein [Mycobacterium sp. 141]